MNKENEELFNNLKEEKPVDALEEINTEAHDDEVASPEVVEEEMKIVISSKSAKQLEEENGKKENSDGKTLTIKSVSIKPPRTKTLKDGVVVKLDPTKTLNGHKKYDSKLIIRFEEDNLIEYVPGINFFLNEDGSINNRVKLNRKGENAVSKLVKLVLAKMLTDKKLEVSDANIADLSKNTSDQELLDFLVGKKVKIATKTGNYKGKDWFRNDVGSIL